MGWAPGRWLSTVLSKQHLLLEHPCPLSSRLSSSDCAFGGSKMPRPAHSFPAQPSTPRTNPAGLEIRIQTTGGATYMSRGGAGGFRGLEHGPSPSSVRLILSLKLVARRSLGRWLSGARWPLATPGEEMSAG